MFISAVLFILALEIGLLKAQYECHNSVNGSVGRCISIDQCPSIYKLLIDRQRNEQQTELMRQITCSRQYTLPWVCCTDDQLDNRLAPTNQPKPDDILPKFCGKAAGSDRIVGGNETALDAYPWLVLIEYRNERFNTIKPLCGGSLISKRYVLTAAHCIMVSDGGTPPTQIRLGEHDLSTEEDCRITDGDGSEDCNEKPIFVLVESYKVHESYVKGDKSGHNDIGIIRMAEVVDYTDFIKPVCLPTDETVNKLVAETDVFAAGWGRTENGPVSDVKKDIKIKIISEATCQRVYAALKVDLFKGQICAGGDKGIDTCSGDSGGPLMSLSEGSNLWQIVGIVSYGPKKCGTEGVPGVYTNVAEYIPWIISNLKV